MRIGLLCYDLGSATSGESRFLINIAKGLKKADHDPVIFSLYTRKETRDLLSSMGIELHSRENEQTTFFSARMIGYSSQLAKKLSRILEEVEACDIYIVMADETLPVIREFRGKKTAFVAQGDWSLIYLIREFRGKERIPARILERGVIPSLRQHSAIARKFDLMLANSRFTASLLSFLYGFPISDIVYPPVDHEVFKPNPSEEGSREPYALVVLRNNYDPLYEHVAALTKDIKIKVVGRGKVVGADNLGFVSESALIELYSNARITLSPNTREFYGYSIVESMSCGTPVLAFDSAGASELLRNGYNGWLAGNWQELKQVAMKTLNEEEDLQIRLNCQHESIKFGIPESTSHLLDLVKRVVE